MKDSIIDKILCSTGYLPPRNEDEMVAFEREYSKVEIDKTFRVDVDNIVYGGCSVKPMACPYGNNTVRTTDVHWAARNYESIPKEVIDKIKKQHKDKDD